MEGYKKPKNEKIRTKKAVTKKMTEEEYRAHPGVNKSTLWEMRNCPVHYKYALDHPSHDTPALKLGRAIHMGILQPEEFNRHYVLAPNWDRRTKDGREMYNRFMEQNADKELIGQDDYNDIVGMYESVWNDPGARDLLTGCEYETPLFWTDDETRIKCKCRLDAHKDGIVVDLKSCANASTRKFTKDAIDYGYDVQAAHYLRGYRAKFDKPAQFWFIAVEKKAPYAVNVIHAGGTFLDRGTFHLNILMDKLKECRKNRKWPGYGKNELILPEWALIPDEDE